MIEVVFPPVADLSESLDFGLITLTEAISDIDNSLVAHGALGGEFGYGAAFENEIFLMHPYCWCEEVDCLWCTPWLSEVVDCTEEESERHRRKQEIEIANRFGPDSCNRWNRAPNFWHKEGGVKVNWYKWIGRDMEVHNPENLDIGALIQECLASLPAKKAGLK